MRRKDETGNVYGRLTVLEFSHIEKNSKAYWRCKCECGNETVICGYSLRRGYTKSCGCDSCIKKIHGMRHNKIYSIWCGIKKRCLNPKSNFYKDYGGRGISICEEWRDDFQAFYDYVSKLEHFGEEGYTLDRINNNGNYEPNNLRWADIKTQCRNRRNNIFVDYQDNKISLVELSELCGIPYKTLHFRYKHGDSGERLIRPVKKNLSRDCLRNVESTRA